jgi:hypothetical protein
MILIAGLPYSGTTMLVDLLEHMGVHMGTPEHVDQNTGEDRLMASPEGQERADEMARRDTAYGLWGYKDPYAFRKQEAGDKNILIFRDPIAMQRKQLFNDLGLTIGDGRRRKPFQVIYVVNDSGGIPSPKFIPIASSRRFRDLSKVNLDEIGIDEPDYILRVKEIHAGTDDLAPMACFVQPRPDGKLWVMDGNHRVLTWAKEPELEIRFLVTL